MKFIVLFKDNDAHSDKRIKYMTEHLEFLASNSKSVQAAGPLSMTDNGDPAGGLWIVDAENLDSVKTLVEKDPFWPTGLRESIKILKWRQVFAQGEVLL